MAFKQFFFVPMDHREIKEISLAKVTLDPANDQRTVRVADFSRDYSDRVGAFHSQRAREKIRLVIQFARRRENTIPRMSRDGAACGRVIQN